MTETVVYAPDLYPLKQRHRRSGHTPERDQFIRDTYGVDPAILADTLGVSQWFIIHYQNYLGLRKGTKREPASIICKLKSARKQKNLPLEWVAEQINMNLRTMRYWEAGVKNPTPANLERWADALGYAITLRPKC